MLATNAVRTAPAAAGRGPQVSDRVGGAIENPPNAAGHGAATEETHHDRTWWRAEARRVVSRHSILAPGPRHSLHDAIVLAEALPTTAQPAWTA